MFPLVDCLYHDISDDNGQPDVSRIEDCSVPLAKCKMLDVGFRKTVAGEQAQWAFSQLKTPDLEVFDFPTVVFNSILLMSANSNVSNQIVDKVNFYSRYFLPNVVSE